MTSVMQRPQPSQSIDLGGFSQRSVDDLFHRSMPRMSSSSSIHQFQPDDRITPSAASALSPPPSFPGMLAETAMDQGNGSSVGSHAFLSADPSSFHMDPSSSSSVLLTPGAPSQPQAEQQAGQPSQSASSQLQTGGFDSLDLGVGIFEDPAVLALATQPFDPRIDFGIDLPEQAQHEALQSNTASVFAQPTNSASLSSPAARSSLAPTTSMASLPPSTAAVHLAPTSQTVLSATTPRSVHVPTLTLDPVWANTVPATKAISDVDLTSMGLLQFPELPASLLDQAPEYEYSLHTQANVFDAVQDYTGAGDEEAARIFGLDNYDGAHAGGASVDMNTGHTDNFSAGGANDMWRYQDASVSMADPYSSTSFGVMAPFQDAQSMLSSSEYGLEPSTAPTSRGSDWKIDPAVMGLTAGQSEGNDVHADKRRRGSLDDASIQMGDGSLGNALAMAAQGIDGLRKELEAGRTMPGSARPPPREPMVPSQGTSVLSGAHAPRTRIASWGAGDGVRTSATANDGWSAQAQENGFGMMQFSIAQRQSHAQHEAEAAAAAAKANATRNEMINALGSALDASMGSDGVAKCPYPNCEKTFAKNRTYNLKAHLRSHSQLKPFQCTHCPRAFSRKHDLERHSRVHSGDKPYLCEACGKGFPRSDALRRHWRVEKECGEKAVEIEAKQPLPSLPPGINTPAAQVKGPMPGMMHFGPPTTTAMAGLAMPMQAGVSMPSAAATMPAMMGAANMTTMPQTSSFLPFHAPHPGQQMMPGMGFDPSQMPYGGLYPGMKRSREE